MDRTRTNIEAYEGSDAVAAYSTDPGLYPVEQWVIRNFFPPPKSRVLDIGCGAGRTTAALVDLGYEVTAVDLATSMVEATRRRAPAATVLAMDATALDMPDHSFDAAWFSFNGIDCIVGGEARVRALTEARRVLRPGATFAFSSHNMAGQLGARLARRTGDDLRHVLGMVRRQVLNPQLRHGWWAFSDQLLYAGRPASTLGQARRAGLVVNGVRGMSRHKDADAVDLVGMGVGDRPEVSLGRLTRTCGHVQYVTATPT